MNESVMIYFFYEYSLKEKEYPLKVRELAYSYHILICLA